LVEAFEYLKTVKTAEPIKLWLAKVGYERMKEMADPELSLDRARETWQKHGRSEKWIQQRMQNSFFVILNKIKFIAFTKIWYYIIVLF